MHSKIHLLKDFIMNRSQTIQISLQDGSPTNVGDAESKQIDVGFLMP